MTEDIATYYDAQFEVWPQCKEAYDSLGKTKRRVFSSPDTPYPIIVQCNPGRVRSTGAKVDTKSIQERPCFLCAKNRPAEQLAGQAIPGWEILVNPFPIFPVHFTIVSQNHRPQDELPLEAMAAFLDLESSCAVFFNGAHAGASAPDHLHFQAILKSELPFLTFLEKKHLSDGNTSSVKKGEDFIKEGLKVHYPFRSYIIAPDTYGRALLQEVISRATDMSNTFVWADRNGYFRILLFERQAHRPACYYKEGEEQLMVSPGAIDMAGVLILPREEDFDKIRIEDINEIYSQV